jgi:hypothetical protein
VIYFIQPGGRRVVKIGYAQCAESRLADLQTANPDDLDLLGTVEGDRDREKALFGEILVIQFQGGV